jgi:2',3'-cyclic-nucleotide 2'-phosphodiesterase (5'-nucleotidase family)
MRLPTLMKLTAAVAGAPARFAIIVLSALLLATSLLVGLQALPRGSDGSALAAVSGPITSGESTSGITNPPKGDAAATLTIPTPIVANGDVLLAQITFEKGRDAGTDAQITPAGWTLALRTNAQLHPNGTDLGQAIFYRVVTDAAAEPTSHVFPFRQAVKAGGAITPFSGVDVTHAGGPIVASSGASGSTGTLTAPAVTASEGAMVVGFFGFKKKDTTLGVPAGMTGLYNFGNPQDVTLSASEELGVTASGVAKVSTPSPANSDKWVAQLVALRQPSVTIQFLNVSDWHGQIDPLSITGLGNVGGAAQISTYWKQDRAANPNTLTLTAGDDFGATPPIANFFNEEPAVLAQRLMGIQVGTFGNHNFDKGVDHLQEMINLAGSPPSAETGAPFRYVSANLLNRDDELSGVEDFAIFDVGGIDVGVVGITNPEAPELVFPGSFGDIVPQPSAPAAMAAKAAAEAAGAEVVVAIIHAGVRAVDAGTGAPSGELIDFANAVSGFDVIFGDHTDFEFEGVINGQLVTENRSKGRTYARTTLVVDPTSGTVLSKDAVFVTPFSNAVTPDPAIVAAMQPFRDELAPIFNVQLGVSTAAIPHSDKCGVANGRSCESLVGNVVTDAMRRTYETDFALTNSGGLRAPLTCPTTDIGTDFCPAFVPPPYPITRGQVNTVLPFGNQAATLDVNGAELKQMLENGVSVLGVQGRFPQVSGLCFDWDVQAAAGSRVVGAVRQAANGTCTGPAVDLTAASTYTLTTNDFVASGGDGYPNFAARMHTREILDNAVSAWVQANTPITPAIQGRIDCVDSNPALAPACPTVLP